jgi:hypothetical protein
MIIINNPAAAIGILPNGTTINGVCQIYSSSIPVTRPDGSSLQSGDILYYSTNNGVYSWNGLMWVGQLMKGYGDVSNPNFANYGESHFPLFGKFLIEAVQIQSFYTNGSQPNWSESNYFTLIVRVLTNGLVLSSEVINNTSEVYQQNTTHWVWRKRIILNYALSSGNTNSGLTIGGANRVGSPTNTNGRQYIEYTGRVFL